MKSRILISSVLTATIALSSVTTALAATFTDVDETHPNYTAIMELSDRGVIDGYPDGSFKPDQAVNRVEAIKMVFAALDVADPEVMVTPDFTDIVEGEWYMPYLEKAFSLGIVEGYDDGTFKPAQTVNLVENLKMLLTAAGEEVPTDVQEDPYADASAGQWYTGFVQFAKDKNLIEADTDNMIYPSQGMSRATLAETIFRYFVVTENSLVQYEEEALQPQPEAVPEQDLTTMPEFPLAIEGMAYSPKTVTLQKGRTIIWTNNDSVDHTVTSDTGDFDSGLLSTGESFSMTFNEIGTYTYHCTVHPQMTGTIIVKEPQQVPTI